MITRSQPASRALAVPSGLLGWRGAAGLTAMAAGAVIITGALLPWVEEFAGLITLSGIRGSNGWIMIGAGSLIAAAGIWQLARGGQASRWLAGLAGFAAAAFAGYLLVQLTRTMNVLGGDSMVMARGGPGLPVVLAGSVAAFATLLFPPSTQTALRRDQRGPAWAWAADRHSTGLRRGLIVALGVAWLIDAALQFQPYMFSRAMVTTMLAPAEAGQPGIIGGPVTLLARLVSEHPVPWNAVFATIQLALAIGLLFRGTARAALAGTVAWSLAVWWLGEGAGLIFTGTASPLTGAPGAALLYAVLALLIWPSGPDEGRLSSVTAASVAAASPLGRYAKPAWAILWAGLAALMLTAPNGASSLTSAGGSRANVVVIAFSVAFAVAAAGVLIPAAVRPALVIAVIAAAAVWAAGEHFGALFTGQATDPNSGPLLILIAIAFWPRPTRIIVANEK